MKRVEKTAPPSYVDGAEDLFKGWGESDPEFFKPEPLIKKAPEGVSEAKYKRCKEHVEEQGGKYNPYAVCAASLQGKTKKVEKASTPLKDISQADRETFEGKPRHEAGDVLGIVSRNMREKLEEKIGQKKEEAVYQKNELKPGMSYKQLQDTDGDMTVEERKNLHLTPNWEAHEVLPIVHPEKRDEVMHILRNK